MHLMCEKKTFASHVEPSRDNLFKTSISNRKAKEIIQKNRFDMGRGNNV